MRFASFTRSLVFALLSASAACATQPRPIVTPRPPVVKVDRAAQVRQHLADRRAENVARLVAYRDAGVFPRNRVSDDVINVFRDERGLLCAVATLIFEDGKLDLVEQIASTNDYIKLATVKDGPVMDWILDSGFTQEELAMIQLPDSPIVETPPEVRQSWVAKEDQRIRDHLTRAQQQLDANRDRSLDLAVTRYLATHPA
jgi:hypothetical protein